MKNKKLPLMLLALACAILVWLYDVTVVNPNDAFTYSSIPVNLDNEDALREQNLMMTSGEDLTVTLRISGRRSELKKLSRSNIQVTADLGQIEEAGRHELPYTVQYPANVSPGDLSIDNRSPAAVSVEVEHYIRRVVEIHTSFEGSNDAGANGEELVIDTDGMEISPAEVVVTGPAALVDTIDCARIVINKEDITQTTVADYDYALLDANGEEVPRDELVTDCETLSVSIPVLKYKEVPLVLKTVSGGGATDDNIEYSLSAQTITISGEAQNVDRISQIELGTLKYAEVTGPATKTYDINLPDGVNNITGIASVDVSVNVKGLEVRTMNVSEFVFTDVRENMSVKCATESLSLTLRGTPAALNNLDPEDIVVKVGLGDYAQPGTFIVAATVEVPEGLQIGAIGSNAVTVTLS